MADELTRYKNRQRSLFKVYKSDPNILIQTLIHFCIFCTNTIRDKRIEIRCPICQGNSWIKLTDNPIRWFCYNGHHKQTKDISLITLFRQSLLCPDTNSSILEYLHILAKNKELRLGKNLEYKPCKPLTLKSGRVIDLQLRKPQIKEKQLRKPQLKEWVKSE